MSSNKKVQGVKRITGFQPYETTKFGNIRINSIKRNFSLGLTGE